MLFTNLLFIENELQISFTYFYRLWSYNYVHKLVYTLWYTVVVVVRHWKSLWTVFFLYFFLLLFLLISTWKTCTNSQSFWLYYGSVCIWAHKRRGFIAAIRKLLIFFFFSFLVFRFSIFINFHSLLNVALSFIEHKKSFRIRHRHSTPHHPLFLSSYIAETSCIAKPHSIFRIIAL